MYTKTCQGKISFERYYVSEFPLTKFDPTPGVCLFLGTFLYSFKQFKCWHECIIRHIIEKFEIPMSFYEFNDSRSFAYKIVYQDLKVLIFFIDLDYSNQQRSQGSRRCL